ncbi:MAG: nucleotidyltransferase family protein [Actinomycetota bacterium]|nr:nucleotidyltransferase family protein [Actinomycetota bacterium]
MFDSLVLAGGAAARLGGADKPAIRVGASSMLDRVLSATGQARRVVVVGPPRETCRTVRWTLESPPGGGPVAALAAGLVALAESSSWPDDRSEEADAIVVVLAADLPWIGPAIPRLLAAIGGAPAGIDPGARTGSTADVAVLVDSSGRRNHLAAAWRRPRLRDALEGIGSPRNAPARALYDAVRIVDVPDLDDCGVDCDTWPDLQAARLRAGRSGDGQ